MLKIDELTNTFESIKANRKVRSSFYESVDPILKSRDLYNSVGSTMLRRYINVTTSGESTKVKGNKENFFRKLINTIIAFFKKIWVNITKFFGFEKKLKKLRKGIDKIYLFLTDPNNVEITKRDIDGMPLLLTEAGKENSGYNVEILYSQLERKIKELSNWLANNQFSKDKRLANVVHEMVNTNTDHTSLLPTLVRTNKAFQDSISKPVNILEACTAIKKQWLGDKSGEYSFLYLTRKVNVDSLKKDFDTWERNAVEYIEKQSNPDDYKVDLELIKKIPTKFEEISKAVKGTSTLGNRIYSQIIFTVESMNKEIKKFQEEKK